MNLINLRLAYWSFENKFLGIYFSTSIIIKAFFISFLLSNCIFFELINFYFWPISLFLSFFAIICILKSSRKELFFIGFFTGFIWFYWISFSFIYYGFWYLLPLGIFAICLVYGLIFLLIGFYNNNLCLKAIILFLINFIHPFGFNWFDLRLIFVNSPLLPNFITLACFIVSAVIFISLKSKFKFILILIILFLNINSNSLEKTLLPFPVKNINTRINQSAKWKKENLNLYINDNFNLIHQAIKENNKLIILPESAFPLFLNTDEYLVKQLKILSQSITIITGSLSYEDKNSYNSTYVFHKGKMQIYHKFFLVPFGEKIPFPKFFANLINKYFYNGLEDFATASGVQDYEIYGVKIRNAICFEATKKELFKNNPNFMIALSNNAWFMPSTQSTIQNLMLTMFATLHHTTIYHSTNYSKSKIITPQNGGYMGKIKNYFLRVLNKSTASSFSQG